MITWKQGKHTEKLMTSKNKGKQTKNSMSAKTRKAKQRNWVRAKTRVNKQRNWCQQTGGPLRQTKPSVCSATEKTKAFIALLPFLCFTSSRVRPVGQILQNFGWWWWKGDGCRLSLKKNKVQFLNKMISFRPPNIPAVLIHIEYPERG